MAGPGCRWLRCGAAALLLAAVASAQQGEASPPPQEPKPKPATEQQPVDPVQRAAEILRRRLGLDEGPTGTPPAGPGKPKPKPKPSPEAAAEPATPEQQEPKPQEPKPREPKPAEGRAQEPAPQDPTESAARALKRLLPGSEPPERAPMPGRGDYAAPAPPIARADASNGADAVDAAEAGGLWWGGSLSMNYRARHGGGATDQNLISRLNVDVGRSTDPLSLHLRTRAFVDVDGRRRDDPFPGLDHSFGDDVNARLYAAHVDVRSIPDVALLRLGRQDLDETPVVLSVDGVRADLQRQGRKSWWLSAYGGVPVHWFEASSSGDSVVGVGGGLSPWRRARVRVDWMLLRDEFLAIDRQDAVLGVRWWQSFDDVNLRGFHSWRDGAPRDLNVSADGIVPAVGTVRVAFRELLSSQRQQVTDIDPYFAIAGELSPFRQIDVSVTRDLSEQLVSSVGVELRRLSDASDEGTFNREFERYYADLTWRDAFARGLSLNAAGNLYESSGESFHALTGELIYRPDRSLRAVLGVGYDLFRYDVLQQRERVRVRSLYLRVDHRLGDGLRIDGGYELLRDDLDEFHLFRLGVTWTL